MRSIGEYKKCYVDTFRQVNVVLNNNNKTRRQKATSSQFVRVFLWRWQLMLITDTTMEHFLLCFVSHFLWQKISLPQWRSHLFIHITFIFVFCFLTRSNVNHCNKTVFVFFLFFLLLPATHPYAVLFLRSPFIVFGFS